MATITYEANKDWSNFHMTLGAPTPQNPLPHLRIKSLAHVDAGNLASPLGLLRFADTGAALFDYLTRLEAQLPTPPLAFAAGTTGQCWSFAPLIGTPDAQLDTLELKGCAMLAADERHPGCPAAADFVALISGGTTLRGLTDWAEPLGRTIRTSGTFLWPSVAGSIGTSSHGSRLGFGGIQNMVLGMHLIVGSGEHVWIEPASAPVLSATGLAKLTINGTPPTLVRDDDRFEDALVHLGAMGIVNGLAVELATSDSFTTMRRQDLLQPAFLKTIAAGDFAAAARHLGCQAPPEFYEITIDPHGLFENVSTHTMYFRTGRHALVPESADIKHPDLVIMDLGQELVEAVKNAPAEMPGGFAAAKIGGAIPSWIFRLLINAPTAFDRYFTAQHYEMINTAFDPDDKNSPGPFRWSDMHDGTITGDTPGALYNASFSIPLEQLARALPLICDAVKDLPPSFVFTVRFVEKACGTLAFTRFEKNAVIELDGLSPLICALAKAAVKPTLPYGTALKHALDILAPTLPRGAKLVRDALDRKHIPYSMHWAKRGGLDKTKVYADFGHPRLKDSLIRQWRQTREMLLTPFGQRVFRNQAVIDYGLLDP